LETRLRWENNNNYDLTEIEYVCVECTKLARDNHCSVAGFCGNANELSSSLKGDEFIYQFSNYQLLKNGFAA